MGDKIGGQYLLLEVYMKLATLLMTILAVNLSAHAADPFKMSIQTKHSIKVLNHGLASLEERLQMLEKAEKSIDVEYFIYNLDKSGRIFTQALIKKASEGVHVRMLLDYAMIKSTFSPFFAAEMKKKGIEVKYFNPTATLNLFSGTYRNHRKVLLIDGKEALTGGRNIGDEYFDLREDFNFLDRDIKISGSVVTSIQHTFNEVWNSELTKEVKPEKKPEATDGIYQGDKGRRDVARFQQDLKNYNAKLAAVTEFVEVADERLLDEIRSKGKEELAEEYSGTCGNVSFNSEYPIIGKKNRTERVIKHDIADRIRNAQESILFDSPYFIVNDDAKVALDEALANNVKVTLLTNSLNSTDAIYVYDVFDSIIKGWIKKGLETYIFKADLPASYRTLTNEISQARFGIHAKSFVFDKKDVVIGTYNFDPRSANLNTEMTVACENNPELAKIVANDIEERIKGSIHLDSSKAVDEAEFYNTSFKKRLLYYVLKVPSNLVDYLL